MHSFSTAPIRPAGAAQEWQRPLERGRPKYARYSAPDGIGAPPLIAAGPKAKETVSKPHLILIKARRGAQMCAHKTLLYQQLIGSTFVRPYATNLDQPNFKTVSNPAALTEPRLNERDTSRTDSAPEVPPTFRNFCYLDGPGEPLVASHSWQATGSPLPRFIARTFA